LDPVGQRSDALDCAVDFISNKIEGRHFSGTCRSRLPHRRSNAIAGVRPENSYPKPKLQGKRKFQSRVQRYAPIRWSLDLEDFLGYWVLSFGICQGPPGLWLAFHLLLQCRNLHVSFNVRLMPQPDRNPQKENKNRG